VPAARPAAPLHMMITLVKYAIITSSPQNITSRPAKKMASAVNITAAALIGGRHARALESLGDLVVPILRPPLVVVSGRGRQPRSQTTKDVVTTDGFRLAWARLT
jgi:hypothetical protein